VGREKEAGVGGMILAAIALIGWGLVCIFGRDLVWELKESSNRANGFASERTPEWEGLTAVGGVVAIILGLVPLVLLIFNG
jgi:hypothetical protein